MHANTAHLVTIRAAGDYPNGLGEARDQRYRIEAKSTRIQTGRAIKLARPNLQSEHEAYGP